MRVIVIGGGIGGLSAAIALRLRGFEVDVYERSSALAELGSGLGLWRNALKALVHLDLLDAILSMAGFVEEQEFRTPDGELLRTLPLRTLDDGSGLPALVVLHRADLQRTLLDRIEQGVVHLGHECARVDDEGDRVVARFTNGESATGEILIGADGLHSTVRANLHGNRAPDDVGVGVWRGIARFDHELFSRRMAFQTLGRGRRFVALPLANGQVYWAGTESAEQGVSRLAAIHEAFRGWHEPIEALIRATPVEAIMWTTVHDRAPLADWGRGRITLVGDAAHPAAPFLGQGACQALEDSVWLARHLTPTDDPKAALRSFENLRYGRTRRIVEASRKMGRMYHLQGPIRAALRNLALKHAPKRVMTRTLREALASDL